MIYLGDFLAGSTVFFLWPTNSLTGASITRATNGTLRVYRNVGATQRASAAGITEVEDFDSLTGIHTVAIDLSDDTDAGFYASGADYAVVMVGMVIDGQTVNYPIALFSIENRSALMPVVSGKRLKVSDAGHAATDQAQIENPGAMVNLSGTTIKTSTDLATLLATIQGLIGQSNIKRNQALAAFQFVMTDATTHAPAAGLTVTVTRSIDGATDAAGTLSAVTEHPSGGGRYLVDFGAGDLDGKVIVLKATAAGADTTFERIITVP